MNGSMCIKATLENVVIVVMYCRPKRTDEGGSRLLRRAILGLGPVLKRGKTLSSSVEGGVIRESKREKVIILPASVLSDGTAKKIMLANVQNGEKKICLKYVCTWTGM